MKNFEKIAAVLSAALITIFAGGFFIGYEEPSVTPYHASLYETETSARQVYSLREKLDLVLGIEDSDRDGDATDLININTADYEELRTLPGIGEELADRIIRYRTYNGSFKEKRHIMDVTGIGEGTYEKISHLICVK